MYNHEEEVDSDSEWNALFSCLLDGPETDDWSLHPDYAPPEIKKTIFRMFQLAKEGVERMKSGNAKNRPKLKSRHLKINALNSKSNSMEKMVEGGTSSKTPQNNEKDDEGFFCTINDPEEIYSLKRKELDFLRCVPFFIKDLYEAKRELTYFVHENVPFERVFIIGRIVEIGESDKSYFIHVSDNKKDSIRCIITKNYHSKLAQGVRIKRSIDTDDEKAVSLGVDFSVVPSFKGIRNFVPNYDEMDLGDVLRIVGRFKKRGTNGSIFIDKFTKETEDVLKRYLATLSEFYHSSKH